MSMENVVYIVNDSSIVVHYNDGETFILDSTHDEYDSAKDLIMNGKVEDFKKLLIDIMDAIANMSKEEFYIDNDTLYYLGVPIKSSVGKLYVQKHNEGNGIEAIQAFIRNVQANPYKQSKASVEELYDFLSNTGMPLTADGCFLAYKYVKKDYKDSHTGTVEHVIGESLPVLGEGEFDPDRNQTCSKGYHFCAYKYLGSYNKSNYFRLLLVKVNPKDVVAIPTDYNNMKGRAVTYEILDEIIECTPIKSDKPSAEEEIESYPTQTPSEEVEKPTDKETEPNTEEVVDVVSNHTVKTVGSKIIDMVASNYYVEDIASELDIKLETVKRKIRDLRSKGSIPADYVYNYKPKEEGD